jgi:hypothetical protein
MAKTPEQIRRELQQIADLYADLGKQNPFAGANPAQIAASATETQKLADALFGVREQVDRMNQSFSDLYDQLKATTAEISKVKTPAQEMEAAFKGSLTQVKKLVDEEKGFYKLSLKELKTLQKRAQIKKADAEAAAKTLLRESGLIDSQGNKIDQFLINRRQLTDQEAIALAIYEGQDTTLKDIGKKIQDRLDKEVRINKSLGLTGALLKGAGGLMDKLGLGALKTAINFDKINDELDEYATSLDDVVDDSGNKLSESAKKQMVMSKGFEGMAESIKKGLNDPLVTAALGFKGMMFVFDKLKHGFQHSDEIVGKLAKNLNISAKEAKELKHQYLASSKGADNLFLSSGKLAESTAEINAALGTNVQFSAEQLSTFTKLKTTAGLTAEEMMGIQKLSLANGKSFDENADDLLKQVSASNKARGIFLNEKQVLKDISNLSAATTLSLGKNPKALGEAVATAKSLGMELSQVEGIAESLLDFESSIEKELEAELLLGKNINLEKARQAALEGDLTTLAKEVASQEAIKEVFTTKNFIAQKAAAEAVGMSREELAKMLFVQEQLAGASGKEAERRQQLLDAKIQEVGLEQAQQELKDKGLEGLLAQASEQEKLNASMDQFNDSMAVLGGALAPIVSLFAKIVGAISESKGLTIALGAALGALGAVATIMAVQSTITAITGIFSSFSKIPFGLGIPAAIGTVAALGGIIGGVGSMIATAGDVMSPAKGKTMISTKEGGLFELSPNDDVVAAPGAAAALAGGGGSSAKLEQLQAQTNNLLSQLLNKNASIKMDSEELGTAISLNNYEVSA